MTDINAGCDRTIACSGAGGRVCFEVNASRADRLMRTIRLFENFMKISVTLVWYNGMGGHPAISYAGEFLLLGRSETYGSAFETMECYPHIPSFHRQQSLEVLQARFDKRVRELPKSWIKRKLRRIEVSYNSGLGTEEDLVGEPQSELSPGQFSIACHEIVSALDIVESKIKRSDDIHWAELKSHFDGRLKQLPKTEIELQTTLKQLRLEDRKRLLP